MIIYRYANTDYALAHSLVEANDQRWIMLSYDIWCQYSVNIQKRFEKWFPEASRLLPCIRGAIPKMHIKNHIASCQQLWAFNYIKYSGETWGENIEGGWAEQNQAAGSTKEQNDGHRHDTLDEFFGFWNWTKLHQIGELLYFHDQVLMLPDSFYLVPHVRNLYKDLEKEGGCFRGPYQLPSKGQNSFVEGNGRPTETRGWRCRQRIRSALC